MNLILAAAGEVEAYCRERDWSFCFIGGIAVQRWGEPRLTQDVDLTLLTGFGTERPYIDALLEDFEPRRPDAGAFARQHRVVLLRSTGGVPIAIALGAMPFEERAVHRASPFEVGGGVPITACSAEDLVVEKAFAGREQDWLDIAGVVTRRGVALDRQLILAEATPLLELEEAATDLDRHREPSAREEPRLEPSM